MRLPLRVVAVDDLLEGILGGSRHPGESSAPMVDILWCFTLKLTSPIGR